MERRHPATTLRRMAIATLATITAACGALSAGDEIIGSESILQVAIPGTSGGSTTLASDGTATKLFDVTGDWSLVSVELARIVQREGWTITALNCVGTGNDVIAQKQVAGEWLKLESGAGVRGAGIIVSRDASQDPPSRLSVTGRCPQALVDVAESAP